MPVCDGPRCSAILRIKFVGVFGPSLYLARSSSCQSSEHWPVGPWTPASNYKQVQSIWGPSCPAGKSRAVFRPMAEPVTLHPSIIPQLDPEYASFHNEHIIHLPQVHELPWDPSLRNTQTIPGSSELLPVGKVEDFNLSRCRVRVFTPEGSPPETGWPVFIFLHGGMGTTPPPQGRIRVFSRRQP